MAVAPTNPAVKDAIARFFESDDDDEQVAAFEDAVAALLQATVVVAVAALPPGVGSEPAPLDDDTAIATLVIQKDGMSVVAVFTDLAELQARAPRAQWLATPGRLWVEKVLRGEFDALVINPSGRYLELSRDLLEPLLGDTDEDPAAGA